MSLALATYRAATALLGPFAGLWLAARARKGKEDAGRLGERFGRYAAPRRAGALVWFHAASVGESGVALILIEALSRADPSLSFLITTGTRTSAELVGRRNDARITHVYAPLDRSDAVRRFFEHWRPTLGVFVESEIWPNLILEAGARGVPLALVNARMSPKTLRRWLRWRDAAARLLRNFAYVSAADARTAQALAALGGAPVDSPGNLKLAATAPRVDASAGSALEAQVGARPLWLAASTHGGEDVIVLAAHDILRQSFPGALLVIAPRHPERGENISRLAGGAPLRSRGDAIGTAPVYVADTLGELGMFYDLAPVTLVAGSLLPHLKGHNPVEPAKLDCAIVTGPHVESFADLYDTLFAERGAVKVQDAETLASAVAGLWRDDAARARQIEAARAVTAKGAEAFEATVAALQALLPAGRAAPRPANASA